MLSGTYRQPTRVGLASAQCWGREDAAGGAKTAGGAGPLLGASLDEDAEEGMGAIHMKQERAGQRGVV
jgi:hypothetical protein